MTELRLLNLPLIRSVTALYHNWFFASSAISTLSNLEMDKMLEDRHQLSQQVRSTVSPLSEKWGYRLGSVYIRKVSFTDRQMVDNITAGTRTWLGKERMPRAASEIMMPQLGVGGWAPRPT